MVDIKGYYTIIIPGGKMIRKEDSLKEIEKPVINKKTGKQIIKNGKPLTKKVLVEDWDKCDKNTLRIEVDKKIEELTFYTRKSIPAEQTLPINKEAYEYMTSKEVPSFSNKFSWFRMNKMERLKAHILETCKSLGGKAFTIQLFED